MNASALWRALVFVGFALMVWLVPATNAEQQAGGKRLRGPDPSLAGPGGESIDDFVARDLKRRERRATPQARAERVHSRRAFRAMSGDEALNLAHSHLPDLIEAPVWDPFAGQKVRKFFGEFGAQLEGPGGKHQVVESTVPLKSKVGSGQDEAVNYSLERSPAGLEPKNPVLRTAIASNVRDGVTVGDGLRIKLMTTADSTAAAVENKAFFANALKDSDLTVAPTPRGIQLGFQVRSEDAPESARFKIEGAANLDVSVVPFPDFKGDRQAKFASDRATPGSAEIRQDGKITAVIRPPAAWDADGQAVETRYVLENSDTLRLDFLHHSADVRYPLLVDPAVERFRMNPNGTTNGNGPAFIVGANGNEPAAWNFSRYGGGSENYKASPAATGSTQAWNSNLQIQNAPNRTYAQSSLAQWMWAAPRSSWLYRADFSEVQLQRQSTYDNQYAECVQAGIATGGTWDNGPITQPSSNPPGYTTTDQNRWQKCGTFNPQAMTHIPNAPHPGNFALFRMIYNRPQSNPQDVWNAYMGAAAVHLEDGQAPAFTPSSGLPGVAAGWQTSASFTAHAEAQDAAPGETNEANAGLGINGVTTSVPVVGGAKSFPSPSPCTRPTSCPWKLTHDVSVSTDDVDPAPGAQPMPEGANTITATASDATGKGGGANLGTVKIDRSAPETLTASGTLADLADKWTNTTGSATLKLSANDKYSGIANLGWEVRQGSSTGTVMQSGSDATTGCDPANGCPAGRSSQAATINLGPLPDGKYYVNYWADDQLYANASAADKAAHRTAKSFVIGVDRTAPTSALGPVSPSGWVTDATSRSTTWTGTDSGSSASGVVKLATKRPSGTSVEVSVPPPGGCTSTVTTPCSSSPSSIALPFRTDGTTGGASDYPSEGIVKFGATTYDAAGNASTLATTDVKIDRSPPTISLGGLLALSRDRVLVADSYNLTIDANDGSASSDSLQRSGVKQIRVLARKDAAGATYVERYASPTQACPQGNCPMSGSWTMAPHDGSWDQNARYFIKVEATDQLGFQSTDEFSVWIGPSVDLTKPLVPERNGLEDFWHYDSTQTGAGTRAHVNLDTGNLVWHSVPIVNPGRGLSTVANVTYNSQETPEEAVLPENALGDSLGQYNWVGRGFSLGISGLTRVNESLDLSQLASGQKIRLTDLDGTRHTFVSGDGCKTFGHPAGVNLRLRRYSAALAEPGCALGTTGGPLTDSKRAWAATRPDGTTHFFDARGFQTSIEDRNGNALTFNYEFRGPAAQACAVANPGGGSNLVVVDPKVCPRRLTSITDAEGQAVSLTYYPDNALDGGAKGSGLVKDVTDHAGRVTHFDYDTNGYLTKLTEAFGSSAGRSFGFGYPAANPVAAADQLRRRPLTEITDPVGMSTAASGDGVTKIDYQSDGVGGSGVGDGLISRNRVQKITNRRSNPRSFAYTTATEQGEARSIATVTDAAGKDWRHSMDADPNKPSALGRPRTLTDPQGTVTKLDWNDAVNAVTKLTKAAGTTDESVRDMEYNANGLLTKQTTHPMPGDSSQDRVRILTYRNGSGTLQSPITDVNDAGGSFVSDLTGVTKPKADTGWTYGLDARGNVTSRTDARGNTATTGYDSFGRIVREEDEQHNVTTYSDFDKTGQPKVMIDPRAADVMSSASQHRWIYGYDAVGNVTSVTDPRGATTGGPDDPRSDYTTRLTYDVFDRLREQSLPKDTNGAADVRITRTTDYDPNNNVTASTDGEGKTTSISSTPMDQPETVTKPGSNGAEVTRYGYDALDQLTSRIDPKGSAGGTAFKTEYSLDALGRRLAEIRNAPGQTPSQLITSYAFDRRDNLKGIVDAKRNVGRTAADAIAAAADPAQRRLSYAYNGDNQRTDSLEKPTGDATDVKAVHITYGYDANGNRTSETSPRKEADNSGVSSDWTTTSEYDHRDQLIAKTTPMGDKTVYTRREDGKVVAKTTPRGVAEGTTQPIVPGSSIQAYKYFTTRYGYDRNGDLQTRSVPFAPGQYGRSDAELSSWQVSYARNAAGGPESVTDARGNTIANTFFDTGDIRSTSRPSWWKVNWAKGDFGAPRAGQRFAGPDANIDAELATGGPQIQEAGTRSTNASLSEAAPKLPSSEQSGNFGTVNPQSLSDMPQAGLTTFTYDSEMRLTSIADTANKTRGIGYDAAGRVRTKSWPFKNGASIDHAFDYDPNGNLKSYTDGEGKTTTFGYDGFDRRSSQTAPGAAATPNGPSGTRTTAYGYDPNGNLSRITTPRAGVGDLVYGYDSLDRLRSEQNPAGERWTYQSDVAGNRVLERSPRGNANPPDPSIYETALRYDAADRLAKATDGFGKDTTFGYDADGNRTTVTAPGAATEPGGSIEARVTSTTYDGRGLPWQQDQGQTGTVRRTVREFDPNGNLRRIVNPKGLDDQHNPTTTDSGSDGDPNLKQASKHATVRTYNADDLVVGEFLPWGDRDARDQRRFRQQWVRDNLGQVGSAFSPYEVGSTSPTAQRSYTYFDNSWVRSSSDEELHNPAPPNPPIGRALVSYDYDKQGNQTLWQSRHESDASGRKVTRAFYPNGELQTRTATKVVSDGSESTTAKRTYDYAYNANDSLVRMDDHNPSRPNGQEDRTTTISRDSAERQQIVNETWSSGKDTRFTYDENGNVATRQTDGRWNAAANGGNGAYEDSPGGRDAKTTTFGYDRLNREISMATDQGTGPSRSITTDYWGSGEVRTKTTHQPGAGNDILEERYFNRQGEPLQTLRKRQGESDWNLKNQTYEYDTNGNRTKDERGTEAFNARDQLVYWKRGAQQTRPDTEVTYELNGTGATEKKTDTALPGTGTDQQVRYEYDGTRLDKVVDKDTTQKYSYDDFGSVTKIQATLNQGNTTFPPLNTPPSDLPAACQGQLSGADQGTTLYCFDEFERMVAARGPGLDKNTGVYDYDGFDRRDSRLEPASTGPDRRRDYSYVGTSRNLSREQTADGKTLYYDYNSTGQREGQSQAPSGQTDPTVYRPYGKDANGSVEQLTNPDGTVPTGNRYVYDPYGERDLAAGQQGDDGLSSAAKDNPFRFEGFYYDSGVKTYDMQARQYRSDTGRFLTRDQYEQSSADLNIQADPLTQDRYAFAGGNPINNIEFDGHVPGQFRNYGSNSVKLRGGRKSTGGGSGAAPTAGNTYINGHGPSQQELHQDAPARPPRVVLVNYPRLLDPLYRTPTIEVFTDGGLHTHQSRDIGGTALLDSVPAGGGDSALEKLYREPGASRLGNSALDQLLNLEISLGPLGQDAAAVTGGPRALSRAVGVAIGARSGARASRSLAPVAGGSGPVSIDDAIAAAIKHVGSTGRLDTTGSGKNFQFISHSTDTAGDRITRIGRLDVNPSSLEAQRKGPHLNLETQRNGTIIRNDHVEVDPTTVRAGDYP